MGKSVSEGDYWRDIGIIPMQPRVAPPKKRSGSMPWEKINDAEPI